jgi:hypothetical protein
MGSNPLPVPRSQAAMPVSSGGQVPTQEVFPVPGRLYMSPTNLNCLGSTNCLVFLTCMLS